MIYKHHIYFYHLYIHFQCLTTFENKIDFENYDISSYYSFLIEMLNFIFTEEKNQSLKITLACKFEK